MRWPCHFVWRCTEENWDTVKERLIKEIKECGFENFVLKQVPDGIDDEKVPKLDNV